VDGAAGAAAARPLVGTVVTLPDVQLAELTASAVDFVWIDLEHGALSARDVAPLAIAARAVGAACLVRIGDADPALARALDAGVDGIVVPRVETRSQAEAAIERLRHPPRGSRGAAGRRASGYGLAPPPADPVCMAQVESAPGVGEAEAIADVDGVDALVVGCADLASDLGADPGGGSDAMRAAIAHVQRSCSAAGIASGVAGPDDLELLTGLAGGRSAVLVLGADVRIYARALRDGLARLRSRAAAALPGPEEAHVRA
jgi:4-hydroxy-2-oxoheptanedioate aldolase